MQNKSYEPAEVEGRWYGEWLKAGYFRADDTSGKPAYCIVLPPPNVTGSLHMGHALTATIQDIFTRWHRMRGFNALWLPGTDHAGIATQMVVEKEILKSEKKSRHDLGREKFLERVWAWKEQYGKRIGEQHHALGASLDWSRERFTMDEGFSRAVREVFVRLYEEGLLYRGNRLINWCPRCITALSDLEVEHEENAQGELYSFAYSTHDGREIVVATTRPETMLGDTAVAVHPDDPRYQSLIGQKLKHPFVDRELVIIGDAILVDPKFGTGAVKVTPAHDFNDYATGLRHSLPMVSIFDERGKVNANGGRFAGLDRKEARTQVKAALAEAGLDRGTKDHLLALGRCQRCDTVVEPMLSDQWFVKTRPLADQAIAAVKDGRTRIQPDTWQKVFFHWMENIQDWCVSRQLWWGHQIPAWYCTDGHITVARQDPAGCATCGKPELRRDPDVLDTWFSSGLWPFGTLGWPDQTPALRTFYPTTLMETGFDILFFWVARMMMLGLHFMGEVPFREVFLHAMVVDDKGEKMSKTRGNVIDPLDIIHGVSGPELAKKTPALAKQFPEGMTAQGADALRFTLAWMAAQGRNIRLSLDRVEGMRHFANKLWNATRFSLRYLDGFTPSTNGASRPTALADRWILSRLEATVTSVNEALAGYRINEAAQALYAFVWNELCDWYIELSKPVLGADSGPERETARTTLWTCLETSLRLLHPFMPFVTEELWQGLPRRNGAPASIMVDAYPPPGTASRDEAAEKEMSFLQELVSTLRNLRAEYRVAPGAKIDVVFGTHSADDRARLERNLPLMTTLVRTQSVQFGERPAGPVAAAVVSGVEVFLPLSGLVDFGAERARLGKDLGKVEADLTKVENKLANEKFIAGAPAEVVAKEREKRAELLAQKEKLLANIAALPS
jgi:valyl-tRNA synthetase